MIQTAYVKRASTREVDQLVQSPGLKGIDTNRVTRIWRDLDQAAERFRQRPLGAAHPCVSWDVSYVKVSQTHGLVDHSLGDRHQGEGDQGAGDPGAGAKR